MQPANATLRSLLFVPGDSPRKLAKANRVAADALVVDWEDAVAPEQKARARDLTVEFLRQLDRGEKEILIRFNSARSDRLFLDDCAELGKCSVSGIMLSKCESAQDVHVLAEALDGVDPDERCRIYPLIESPLGLLNAFSIASASLRVAALCFGAEDFCAEAGILPSSGDRELLYARSALVVAARAAGHYAVDSPNLEFLDLEPVKRAARAARRLGFAGKLAIHPAQIPTLNMAFAPTEAETAGARRLLEAAPSETGAFANQGKMVDQAVLRRARSILEAGSRAAPREQKE